MLYVHIHIYTYMEKHMYINIQNNTQHREINQRNALQIENKYDTWLSFLGTVRNNCSL